MGTGCCGTFVISWSQTVLDGLQAAPLPALSVGATWSWHGEPVRVDGTTPVLPRDRATDETDLRREAARMVRCLVGAAMTGTARLEDVRVNHPRTECSFVVTDGRSSYTVTLIDVGLGAPPLLMFLNQMPPRGCDLWIVHHTLVDNRSFAGADLAGAVICFTPGTQILTPGGPTRVEALREGDMLQTKDNGAQQVQWIGSRQMSGARLFALPKLRPIRIRAGAFGIGEPEQELLVSPGHRMVVRGVVARDLFNTDEVLVAAKDLLNGGSIVPDTQSRGVTYYHLLLPHHEVLFANGVETESFHPANTALSTVCENDRNRLLSLAPHIANNPQSYGGYARRNLTASEAAILKHQAA